MNNVVNIAWKEKEKRKSDKLTKKYFAKEKFSRQKIPIEVIIKKSIVLNNDIHKLPAVYLRTPLLKIRHTQTCAQSDI